MRPIPPKRHHWATLAFLVIVAGNLWLNLLSPALSDRQQNLLAEVLKWRQSDLFRPDGLFGDTAAVGSDRLHLPAWHELLDRAYRLSDQRPTVAFMILGSGILLIYLLCMYSLLYRQTRSISVSATTAILSTAVFSTHSPFLGFGPLFTATPDHLFLAFAPLIVLAFLVWRRTYRVWGAFLLLGVLGNIQLMPAINLAGVLLLTVLGCGHFRALAWRKALMSLAALAIGLSPAIIYYAGLAHRAAWPYVPPAVVQEAVGLAAMGVLYPTMLISALRFLPLTLILLAPAGVILGRAGRYRVREFPAWGWFLIGCVVVGFGCQGLMQTIAWLSGRPPLAVGFFDALGLMMIPLYALFAQAMIHLIRLARTHRFWVRSSLIGFAVIYLLSSQNLLPLRARVRGWVDSSAAASALAHDARLAESLALSRWAGGTSANSLFLANWPEIRVYGRRSILGCPADIPYLLHLRPEALGDYVELLQRQASLVRPPQGSPADAYEVALFAQRMRRTHPAADEVYVIFPATSAPATAGALTLIEPPQGQWGKYYRLYRLGKAAATASAPATGPATAPGGG